MGSKTELVRYTFLVANALCWLASLLQIGYCAALIVTQPSTFDLTFGSEVVLYVLLVCGIALFICGFIGCLTGVRLNSSLIKAYIVLVAISLVAEISLTIYTGVISSNSVSAAEWESLSDGERDDIQIDLQCCGFSDPQTEFSDDNGTLILPLSCFFQTDINGTIYFSPHLNTCNDLLVAPMSSTTLAVLIVSIIICFIYILGIVTSALLLSKIKDHQEDDIVKSQKTKPKRKYRFVRGPMSLGKQYSDLE